MTRVFALAQPLSRGMLAASRPSLHLASAINPFRVFPLSRPCVGISNAGSHSEARHLYADAPDFSIWRKI